MEGELIIVTIISSTFGLIGILLLNHNWFKRQKVKYDYQLKRAKLSKKMKVPVKEEKTTMDTLTSLAPLLKNLDADQIGGLIDVFTGGGGAPIEESTGLESILENIPPDMIKSFLKGLSTKESAPGEKWKSQD